ESEQNAQKQPQISVQNKILIRLHANKSNGDQEKAGIPKNHERNGEPRRAAQALHYPPSGEENREGHHQPQNQTPNSHLHDERAEAALDPGNRRLRMKVFRNILRAKRTRANAVPVGPALIAECGQKIPKRIIPRAVLQVAGLAVQRKCFRIESHTRQERLGEEKEQQRDAYRRAQGRSLNTAQDSHYLSLPPRGAPEECEAANQSRPAGPKNGSTRRT